MLPDKEFSAPSLNGVSANMRTGEKDKKYKFWRVTMCQFLCGRIL